MEAEIAEFEGDHESASVMRESADYAVLQAVAWSDFDPVDPKDVESIMLYGGWGSSLDMVVQ
jgi:hypothetical protein